MITFDRMRLYTQAANSINFGRDPDSPHMLLYFSENSTLIDDFPYLNIRRMDFRNVVVPLTRIPKTKLTSDVKASYKATGLKAYSSNQPPPKGQNFIFDISNFLQQLDKIYGPPNYRQRAGFLIKNLILRSFTLYPGHYNKTLLYSINTNNEFLDLRNRKIFPIIEQIKEEQFYFENMLLGLINEDVSSYRLLMKDKEHDFKKIYNYIKMVKPRRAKDKKAEEESTTEEIFKKIEPTLTKKNISIKKSRISSALKRYFDFDQDAYKKILDGELDEKQAKDLVIKSILFNVSGDLQRSNKIANSIPDDKKDKAIKSLEENYVDEILPPGKAEQFSTNVINNLMDITGAVDNVSPDQLFNKRQIDFNRNLIRDISSSFKMLENKDYPFSVQDVKVEEKPPKAGELDKSDTSTIKVTLKNNFDRTHVVPVEVPKIDESGTFRINGNRQCLMNQIVQCPITFPKPYDSKFESSYSRFHIWSKRTVKKKFLQMYMGTYILPFLVFLGFSHGLEHSLKKYKIDYEIVDEKPKKDQNFSRLGNKYLLFKNLDTGLKQEVADSIKEVDFSKYDIKEDPTSKEFFGKLIEEMTERVNSTYMINQNLSNIVDPTAKEILVNMQLPYDLKEIIYYMASRVVEGYVIERNDLGNQRIRNSEVIAHLVQKQVHSAYTQYRQQVLAGNTEAKLDIRRDKALNDFTNSEIVVPMEYANPIEEMSSMTRVSPTGRMIGGIPDKRAIQAQALNVHNSYFGNIDPLDTPESDRIGIVQQLAIGAFISSSRGLFSTKDITDDEASRMLSTSTALVPFLENNDGARVLMYANQAKQMLPLKNPQPPMIQSGYESILPKHLSGAFSKKSPCKGKIEKITRDQITIKCSDTSTQNIDISPTHLRSGSGKDTLSTFRPNVKEGQSVNKGAQLAEGGCMASGQISMGKNLLTALMPYAGYNFEDAIIISDRLYKEGTLTSLHGIEEKISVSEEDRIINIASVGDDTEKGEALLVKSAGDLEEILGVYEDEDQEETIDVTGRQITKKSPGGKIVEIEAFTNIEDYETKFPELKDLINKTIKKYKKPKGEKFTKRGETIEGILINFRIEQELSIQVGDKLANRHGNKGIIAKVLEHDQMPVTPWGENVDIALNPLGVIGRMNMGQIFELYCGLISRSISDKIKEHKDHKKTVDLFNRVLPKLDNTKNKSFSSKFITKMKNMSKKSFQEFLNQIDKDGFTPVIIPPFKSPKYSQIIDAMKELGLESGYNLRLPEFNGARTDNKVPIGYMYISKLEHIGSEILHARSTGPVGTKSVQPTAGKKAEGGSKIGEGDTHALISYGAIKTLNEFFGALSDDQITKNEIISEIIEGGGAEYKTPKSSPTRSLINSYFTSLMLEG